MDLVAQALLFLIQLYELAVFVYVVLSFLIDYRVINASNDAVRTIWNFLAQIIEPALAPIRKFVKPVGQLDFSPLVLLLLLLVLKYVVQALVGPGLIRFE